MIAVVCHDAGGAEIISSWLKSCHEQYCLVLQGPAVAIFKRKLGECDLVLLNDALKKCDWLLCGTSWQSDLERQAISLAKKYNKRSVAFLDHWVNYRHRFLHEGSVLYPDEIWVGDRYAEKLANAELGCASVIMKGNPYLEDLRIEMCTCSKLPSRSVLYVCEPIREHALLQYGDERYWGYTEEDALSFFLDNIQVIDAHADRVVIRPHPSENKDKYDWAKKNASLLVEIGGDKTLLQEITESQVVVGCESMAMIVGLLAGKRVVSTIPPGGKPCSLPHSEIEHLEILMRNSANMPND